MKRGACNLRLPEISSEEDAGFAENTARRRAAAASKDGIGRSARQSWASLRPNHAPERALLPVRARRRYPDALQACALRSSVIHLLPRPEYSWKKL